MDRETVRLNPVLSFFTEEAFRYFLPAYLRYSISESVKDSEIIEETVLTLSPGKEDASSSSFYQIRLKLFNDEQLNTIIRFLDWVRDHPDGYRYYKNIDRGKPRLMKYFRESHR